VAYRTIRSREIAEEIVQDVFYTFWDQRHSVIIRDALSLYLHVAVRNNAYKYHRHTKVIERHVASVEDDPGQQVLGSTRSFRTPAEALAESETERALLDALVGISDRDRDILVLRWRDGWSFEEIGRTIGISSVAARIVVSRQQRRLKVFLDRLRDELRGS
jgi:RNA polymerase sigma-70 factor (ECF subfamily)